MESENDDARADGFYWARIGSGYAHRIGEWVVVRVVGGGDPCTMAIETAGNGYVFDVNDIAEWGERIEHE